MVLCVDASCWVDESGAASGCCLGSSVFGSWLLLSLVSSPVTVDGEAGTEDPRAESGVTVVTIRSLPRDAARVRGSEERAEVGAGAL